jgi:hypothetical protein
MNPTNWNLVETLETEIATAHKAGNVSQERAARARWELAMGIGRAPAPTGAFAAWAKGTILASAK